MHLDENLKRRLRELGHAINETVSDSERISESIAGIRSAGYDIVLKLDATIGLARREDSPARLTSQDRNFLEALHIRVDEETPQDERATAKLEVTPQDIRFLKSLKISLDESL